MKKLYFFICLLAGLLSFSCINPNSPSTQSSSPTTQQEEISAGWYLYTTNANSTYKQTTYFYINTNGSIERAGSSSNEYSGTQLELLQNQLSYSLCKKNADGLIITFAVTEAPIWATSTNADDDEETDTSSEYLSKIYSFLTDFGSGTFISSQVGSKIIKDTISFSNLSNSIKTDENGRKYITCTLSYENQRQLTINSFEQIALFSSSTSGTKNNTRIYYYEYESNNKTDKYLLNVKNKSYQYNVYDELENSQAYILMEINSSSGTNLTIQLYDTDGSWLTFIPYEKDDNSDEDSSTTITLQEGYEWWCFENAYIGNLNCYVLYDENENPLRAGTDNEEVTSLLYLNMTKTTAISSYRGTSYQITYLTQLPSWCY